MCMGVQDGMSAMVDCLEKEFKKKERVGRGTTVQGESPPASVDGACNTYFSE
jgi:hypothetical protein